jgi:hypothetical protein
MADVAVNWDMVGRITKLCNRRRDGLKDQLSRMDTKLGLIVVSTVVVGSWV